MVDKARGASLRLQIRVEARPEAAPANGPDTLGLGLLLQGDIHVGEVAQEPGAALSRLGNGFDTDLVEIEHDDVVALECGRFSRPGERGADIEPVGGYPEPLPGHQVACDDEDFAHFSTGSPALLHAPIPPMTL